MTRSDPVPPAWSDEADEETLRETIRREAERLSNARPDDPGQQSFREELMALSRHASGKIRQAVAEACERLPGALADGLLQKLRTDTDGYVVNAALRSLKRRGERKENAEKRGEHGERAQRLLSEIETKHGHGARRLAERACDSEKELFVRKLHHELSKVATPLEVSLRRVQTELARNGVEDDAVTRNVTLAIERFDFLVGILESARSCTESLTPDFTETDVGVLVETARVHLFERLDERRTRVAFESTVPGGIRLRASRLHLLQAFQNVLQNGVEAHEGKEGSIRLRISAELSPKGDRVTLTFRDFGVGMSEERVQQLFVPFETTKKRGTGVGLVIARRMVHEVHGGVLTVESIPGEGTTVRIMLPLSEPVEANPAPRRRKR